MNSLWVSLQFFVLILAELTVLFLAISTLVGLVFEYVSNDTVRRWLAHKGWRGNVVGAAIGAVTPFCSCSAQGSYRVGTFPIEPPNQFDGERKIETIQKKD